MLVLTRRVVMFDVDAASRATLQEALPEWEVHVVKGASVSALAGDWNPGAADLLVVGARSRMRETLGLCRFLTFCRSYWEDFRPEEGAEEATMTFEDLLCRHNPSILVLVNPGQETLVQAALEAGVQNCLVLPIHPKEVTGMLRQLRTGSPGRHTLNYQLGQQQDPWRDIGGEG